MTLNSQEGNENAKMALCLPLNDLTWPHCAALGLWLLGGKKGKTDEFVALAETAAKSA